MKQLIITEKKDVAKKFVKAVESQARNCPYYFEGDDYVIAYLRGHLIRLANPAVYRGEWKKFSLNSLPIDPGQFLFEIIPKCEKHFAAIKALVERRDIGSIIIATDCGREGELLARLVLQHANHDERKKPLFRFWTSNSLTTSNIQETLKRLIPAKEKEALYQSGLARMIADWLVGFNSTRAITCRFSPGEMIEMGRVKGAILRILMQRQMERESFIPEDYWTIKGRFVTPAGEEFIASWNAQIGEEGTGFLPEDADEIEEIDEDNKRVDKEEGVRFKAKVDANKTVNRICLYGLTWQKKKNSLHIKPGSDKNKGPVRGVIMDVLGCQPRGENGEIGLKFLLPPQMFSLTTLQQEAHREFGFSMDRTAAIAQELYLSKELITYPRTESVVLDTGMLDHVRLLFDALRDDGVVPFDFDKLWLEEESQRNFDTKKIVEDHHALIPSGQPAKSILLSSDERKIYELIVRRFIAAFYPPYKYRSIKVEIRVGSDLFRARKTVVWDEGWKRFYSGPVKVVGGRDNLENLEADMPVRLKYLIMNHDKTQIPPPLNDSTLLNAMVHFDRYIKIPEGDKEAIVRAESLRRAIRMSSGIGTPSSRGGTLKAMVEKGSVYRLGRGRGLEVQDKGKIAFRAIEHLGVLEFETTARWELAIEKIARAQGENLDSFVDSVKTGVREFVANVKSMPKELADEVTPVGSCPACHEPVVEKAKSYSCKNHAKCGFILWKNNLSRFGKDLITVEEAKDLLKNNQITLKGLKGRAGGKTFDTSGKLAFFEEYKNWGVQCSFGAGKKETENTKIPVVIPPNMRVASTYKERRPIKDITKDQDVPLPPENELRFSPKLRTKPEIQSVSCCEKIGFCEIGDLRRPHWRNIGALSAAAQIWSSNSPGISKEKALLILKNIRGPMDDLDEHIQKQGLNIKECSLPANLSLWDLLQKGEKDFLFQWIKENQLQPNFKRFQRIGFVSMAGEGDGVIQDILYNHGLYMVITVDKEDIEEGASVREVPWELTFCLQCNTSGVFSSVLQKGQVHG